MVYVGPYAGVSEYDLFMLKQWKAMKENRLTSFSYETAIKASALGFKDIEEYITFMKECHIQMFGPSFLAMPEKRGPAEQ
jgi:hypothetical protein